MGKFIGLIAAALDRTNGGFVQTTELLEFADEVWVYYCRPHLGAPPAGWVDLAAETLRVAFSPPPFRRDHLAWQPRVTRDAASGVWEYVAEAFGVEPGNNLFHLALPPGCLPVAASWDAPPLYGHADGARFVLGWGGVEAVWPAFRFEAVAPEAFAARAAELDRDIEQAARQRRRQVIHPWGPQEEPDRAALLRQLDEHLGREDVRTLVFELGIDYDNLAGEAKIDKLRELLLHLGRQEQLPRLIRHLQQHYAYVLQ